VREAAVAERVSVWNSRGETERIDVGKDAGRAPDRGEKRRHPIGTGSCGKRQRNGGMGKDGGQGSEPRLPRAHSIMLLLA